MIQIDQTEQTCVKKPSEPSRQYEQRWEHKIFLFRFIEKFLSQFLRQQVVKQSIFDDTSQISKNS